MSIWSYKKIIETLDNNSDLITLNEGNTPEVEFQDNQTKLILKREDKNPTGSWKDRGSAYKITQLLTKNIHEAVIASSGNAAISLMSYANKTENFRLHVVISKETSTEKRNLIYSLARDYHQIYEVEQMRMKAVELSSELRIPNLKVSIDDEILPGYWSLGFEISKHFQKQDNTNNAIFIPVSSGTTLIGLTQGLQMSLNSEFSMPKIFAVQSQKVNPIAKLLHPELPILETSLADAIVDNKGLRSPQILKILNETQGDALNIKDEELVIAKEFLQNKKIEDVSYTSLLSVAGYMQISTKYNFNKVILILSGR